MKRAELWFNCLSNQHDPNDTKVTYPREAHPESHHEVS